MNVKEYKKSNEVKIEDRMKFVLDNKPFIYTRFKGDEEPDTGLSVSVSVDNKVYDLVGNHRVESLDEGVESYDNVIGSDELMHLSGKTVREQLNYIYNLHNKSLIRVRVLYLEEYGTWESGKEQEWEVEFTFP